MRQTEIRVVTRNAEPESAYGRRLDLAAVGRVGSVDSGPRAASDPVSRSAPGAGLRSGLAAGSGVASEVRVSARVAGGSEPLAAARSCGDCRVCCKIFEIAEVNKPLNTMCRHAGSGSGEPGCKIYGHRPDVCRSFECSWKLGLAGEHDRPDQLGVIFYTVNLEDGGPGLAIVESTAGAFKTPRVRALIAAYQERKPGRIILRTAEERRFRQASILIEGKPLAVGSRQ